jgi:glutamate 5-kinase
MNFVIALMRLSCFSQATVMPSGSEYFSRYAHGYSEGHGKGGMRLRGEDAKIATEATSTVIVLKAAAAHRPVTGANFSRTSDAKGGMSWPEVSQRFA